jgi:hypothetical protein
MDEQKDAVLIRDDDRRMTIRLTDSQVFFRTDFDPCFFHFGDGHWLKKPTTAATNAATSHELNELPPFEGIQNTLKFSLSLFNPN